MAPDNTDLMVHDVIGRLFEEPEPMHRADLADGAIAHGMAATRRRGFAVAGATLSVLAVVAGAVVVASGGRGAGGDDWSLGPDTGHIAPQAYEDAGPSYADREREIVAQLPTMFGALLPAGVTVSPDQRRAGGFTYVLTGDYSPELELRSGGSESILHFDGVDGVDGGGYTDAFARASVAPIAAADGTIRVAVLPTHAGSSGGPGYTAWYEFTPADAAKPEVRFSSYGDGKVTPIDAAAFKKMVESPGFAKLQQLLDPAVPASAAAVRQRYAIEAKINAEAVTVLPPGFRLKLSPGAPGELELVGPGGVNAFQWFADIGSQGQISCPVGSLCFALHGGPVFEKVGPDSKERLGVYEARTSSESSVVLQVFGKPGAGAPADGQVASGKPGSETAPQGPGLTPQQAMAIIRAPGAAKVIKDVQALTALK